MPDDGLLCADTTDAILNSFYKVYNTLGFGFLEKVYENFTGRDDDAKRCRWYAEKRGSGGFARIREKKGWSATPSMNQTSLSL